MSVVIELSPLEAAIWLLTGRGNQILWTEADVQEHYRQKRLKAQKELEQQTVTKSINNKVNYQTKFTDDNLIGESLKQAKISFTRDTYGFYFNIPNNEVEMIKTSENNYEMRISGDCNQEVIQKYYERIGQQYEKAVQKQICNNIKEQVARSYNMNLESEEILEDNSVLLTINI